MAPNRRKREREVISRMKQEILDQNGNIPTDEEVAVIKARLALTHRTEADWRVIKDIFNRRELICSQPSVDNSGIEVIDHFVVQDGRLIAFTNLEDALRFMKELSQRTLRFFSYQFNTRSFTGAFQIADERSMELFIDPPTKDRLSDRFIAYSKGEITAVMTVKK